jgi:dolichyl-phosphate beta-glucosyltransferase
MLFKKGFYQSFKTYFLENDNPIDNIELSLVVPAFNEESRLPKMMDETIKYLITKQNLNFEIIIVNDGSRDSTWTVIEDLITKRYRDVDISGVFTTSNGGKGHAVKSGMQFARGKYILMLDADGATEISELATLIKEIERIDNEENGKLVIGSRSIATDESDSVHVRIIHIY